MVKRVKHCQISTYKECISGFGFGQQELLSSWLFLQDERHFGLFAVRDFRSIPRPHDEVR